MQGIWPIYCTHFLGSCGFLWSIDHEFARDESHFPCDFIHGCEAFQIQIFKDFRIQASPAINKSKLGSQSQRQTQHETQSIRESRSELHFNLPKPVPKRSAPYALPSNCCSVSQKRCLHTTTCLPCANHVARPPRT